jgi:predicted phosphoadenosine phosphosulfate sulfurtransferase
VRRPPAHCQFIPEPNIQSMITPERFPPADGHHLYAVLGLRVQESKGRLYGLYSSGGYLTRKPNQHGVYGCRPIYDWTDGDVWRAHLDGGWDYNSAYDVMAKSGLPRPRIRIAPPTMNVAGLDQLAMAAAAWPQWFDRLARRCPGVRLAVRYGRRAFQARHLPDESWEDTYRRECIDTAPAWIAERAERAAAIMTKRHAHHATTPFPQIEPCQTCAASVGSWQRLCRAMYGGDPFSIQTPFLPYVEPSRFRPGAPDWNGSPSF